MQVLNSRPAHQIGRGDPDQGDRYLDTSPDVSQLLYGRFHLAESALLVEASDRFDLRPDPSEGEDGVHMYSHHVCDPCCILGFGEPLRLHPFVDRLPADADTPADFRCGPPPATHLSFQPICELPILHVPNVARSVTNS